MKSWLVYLLKKAVENIFVDGLKYLFGVLFLGSASYIYSQVIQNFFAGQITNRWLLYLPYTLVAAAIFYMIFRIPLIPRLSWEYIFGLNQHTICYIEKDQLEFTKTLSIWPLSKCVHQVSYDYTWTGSEIEDIALKKIDGEVTVDNHGSKAYPNQGTIRIDFNESPRLMRRCECDVIYKLNDKNHKMKRKLVITVKRPTLRIVLRVVANPCVRLKNVTAFEYALYGDKTALSKSTPLHSVKYGTHVSAQTYYEWEIKHPKLFSKYEITWDIV